MTSALRRSWVVSSLLATTLLGGCASTAAEESGASTSDITNIDNSPVKRQSIGNCWVYAMHSWVEAIHLRATGTEANYSESYMTYWHFFEQIANSGVTEVDTSGSFYVASSLLGRYGMIPEGAFLPAEADAEMSNVQKNALDAINRSLKTGALSTEAARRDRKLVRAELDKAFELSTDTRAMLDKVFGDGVNKTLDQSYRSKKTNSPVLRDRDIEVTLLRSSTYEPVKRTLDEAIVSDAFMVEPSEYPSDPVSRRFLQIRIQRALHAGFPVLVSWAIDFNALTTDSKFSMEELQRRGPGRQGGHMTLITDYQAKLASGTVLKVGEQGYSASQLEQAQDLDAAVEFFRVKNSWGAIRPDRWTVGDGYHDLTTAYLDGPIKWCTQVNGTSDTQDCPNEISPLRYVVLPAEY